MTAADLAGFRLAEWVLSGAVVFLCVLIAGSVIVSVIGEWRWRRWSVAAAVRRLVDAGVIDELEGLELLREHQLQTDGVAELGFVEESA